MKRSFTLALALVASAAFAESASVRLELSSPRRPLGTDYRKVIRERLASPLRPFNDFAFSTALDHKKLDITPDLSLIPEVSAETLAKVYAHVRDTQFLATGDERAPMRRLTWLFPDDGCFARAQLGGLLSLAEIPERPAKLYAFGNLVVQTPNSPAGEVGWWYHVAPALRVGSDVYVIDPSIDASGAMPLRNWIVAMGGGQTELAVCSAHSYVPTSECRPAEGEMDEMGYADARHFLGEEWNRVESLGRDPVRELGDSPPWKR